VSTRPQRWGDLTFTQQEKVLTAWSHLLRARQILSSEGSLREVFSTLRANLGHCTTQLEEQIAGGR